MKNLLVFALATFLALPAWAQTNPIEIEEWTVEWENTRPRDPSLADDGRVWLVGQAGDYAAVFDPATEEMKRFDLPEGAGPHTVYITRDDEIWYTGNKAAHLGRIDPQTGDVTRIEMPEGELKDPHTLFEDSQGRLWFTAQWSNQVGRYNRETGDIDHVDVPTENARPYGIEVAADDTVWVVLLGTNKLARISQDMQLTEIELPREDARPRRIAITDRGIWYVDYARGYLGVYDPQTQEFKEWQSELGPRSGPYALADDAQGRLWFVETHPDPNRFVGFDPDTEVFFSITPIPSGAGAVRHMVFDAARNAIWFGTDTNKIGKASLSE
ncbi:MAG: lyase [Wenzhouxiangellaceae bacterium]|nr:lyase [Wenzhouxiangellaceae bacterium]